MPAVVLRMPGLAPLNLNTGRRPHGQFTEPVERARRGKWDAVVGPDHPRETKGLKVRSKTVKANCSVRHSASHVSSNRLANRDRQRIAVRGCQA